MSSIKWQHVFDSPIATIKIICASAACSVVVLMRYLFSPSTQELSLRTEIVRLWYGFSLSYNSDVIFSEPRHNIQTLEVNGVKTFAIPSIDASGATLRDADAIYIHAHGGGLAIGHPLQSIETYKRWIAQAAEQGKKLVILAPVYPLSPQARWPAQRDAFLNHYEWVLAQQVDAGRIVFGGDSAGANLAALSLLHIRGQAESAIIRAKDTGTTAASKATRLPAAMVMHSPYLDTSAKETQFTSRIQTDYMFNFSTMAPQMSDILRPPGTSPDTPEISALFHADIARLPPHLVFYSTTEVLAADAINWIQRCRAAAVPVTVYSATGELHVFSIGWPLARRSLQDECDDVFIRFIFSHVA